MSRQYLTAKEAADMTGLSERTIRRYIASGRTPARKVAPNRFAIAIDDLHSITKHADGEVDATQKLWAAIEELRQELRSAKTRISALEAGSQAPNTTNRINVHQTEIPPPTIRTSSRGLPPGLVSLNSFCADHRININTVKGAIKRGELSYHGGSWKVGSTKVEYALDEGEQAAILERYG
jgi:excisionase family DNA binding protein